MKGLLIIWFVLIHMIKIRSWHTDESMKLYESLFRNCVFGVGKLPNALLVSLFKGSWFHDTINTSNLDNYFPLLDCLSSLKLCFYGYKDACSVARPDPEKNRMDLVQLQTLQPWLRWWKAIQVRGPRNLRAMHTASGVWILALEMCLNLKSPTQVVEWENNEWITSE